MDTEAQTWADVERLTARLARLVSGTRFDAIVGVLRGGLVPACLLSQRLDLRPVLAVSVASYEGRSRSRARFYQFPSTQLVAGKRILVVDDIWDSGQTAVSVRARLRAAGAEPVVAVLHYKASSSRFADERPDHFAARATGWVVYPWEKAASGRRGPRP